MATSPFRLFTSSIKITCAAHLFLTSVFQIAPVQGPSMLPLFTVDGDAVAIDMTASRGRQVSVGDVVMFKIPISAHTFALKRIIGLPGDFISCGTAGQRGADAIIQVPEGHCWVTGDNMPASRDSRHYGPVPLALLQGKVIAKVLPWRERSWFKNPLQSLSP